MPLAGPDPASPEDWVKLAMEQNARLISSRLAADVTRHNVDVERGGYFPYAGLRGEPGHSRRPNRHHWRHDHGDTSDNEYDTVYGLQVTVPIFSGGLTHSRVRQAQYRNIAARERLERTARETERATRDAYLGVNSEVARVQSLKQAVDSAQTALEATEAGYEVGTRTSVDVLQARQRLFQSQTDYARSRYDYLLNVLRLQLAAGTLDQQGPRRHQRAADGERHGPLTRRPPRRPALPLARAGRRPRPRPRPPARLPPGSGPRPPHRARAAPRTARGHKARAQSASAARSHDPRSIGGPCARAPRPAPRAPAPPRLPARSAPESAIPSGVPGA